MYKADVLYEDTCIRVYDPEKKELIAVFKTYAKASSRLGVRASTVQHKCESKRRMLSPILNKEVACRIGVIKDGDKELIDRTEKYLTIKSIK
jgi:hypothetical protein